MSLYPSHIPPLSQDDETAVERLGSRAQRAADRGRRPEAEALLQQLGELMRQSEIRACLRVAAKLERWIAEGRTPARHAEWADCATRLRQTARLR